MNKEFYSFVSRLLGIYEDAKDVYSGHEHALS